MPIKVTCPGCQKTYSVPDTTAGKKVKCPACQQVIEVPAAAVTGTSLPGASSSGSAAGKEMWRVRTGDGQGYGPVSKKELDEWVAEGRLDANCQVLRDGESQWRWATELYPQLAQQEQLATPSAHGLAAQAAVTPGMAGASGVGPGSATNPYAYTGSATSLTAAGVGMRPHRGGMALTLGIISGSFTLITFVMCLCCPYVGVLTSLLGIGLGIPAWTIGAGDMKAMRMGRMDPGGRGLSTTGFILGMISVILSGLLLLLWILFLVLYFVFGFAMLNMQNAGNFRNL
jgi:hypothetical protein